MSAPGCPGLRHAAFALAALTATAAAVSALVRVTVGPARASRTGAFRQMPKNRTAIRDVLPDDQRAPD